MVRAHKKDACVPVPIFSLCVNQSLEGAAFCPTPLTAHPPHPECLLAATKKVGRRKARPRSSMGERRWHRKQSRRQMDQQMVSFRRIPEDDRAAGHMQRESGRDRQRNRDGHRQREREREEEDSD